MPKINEKNLIIKKETSFDIVRKKLLMLFFYEEYQLEREINNLIKINKVDVSKIVIPREIKI